MPISKTTDPEPSEDTTPAFAPDEVDPNTSAVFRDGDAVPVNAKSKSISGRALEMTMGFDCNGIAGNPGDTVFFFNGRCIILPPEPKKEDTSK